MATVTQATLTCDVCGNAEDVKTRTFGLDGKAYEIDLCRRDRDALSTVTARYIAKARKVTGRPGRRQHGGRPRPEAANAANGNGAGGNGAGGNGAGGNGAGGNGAGGNGASGNGAGGNGARTPRTKASGRGRVTGSTRKADGASTPTAKVADTRHQKGIYVYGILPADIEVAADVPGVGEHPGPLRDVRIDGLAALISEVDLSGQLGSPDDMRTYREILDSIAAEVPVLPMRFGTVLASENAVAEELLGANHDEFTAALDRLEGHAEFQVKGRYVENAILGEVLSAAARREEDTRALRQAMEGVCVASVAREPAHEQDSVHVAFLVAVDKEREVERVIKDLAREWEGRIEVQLLGPMAAYDFT